MNTIEQTEYFAVWLKSLKDLKAKAAILKRIKRMENNIFGDVKSIKGGLFEMRIDVGQGWRVYYFRSGEAVYLLVSGGRKTGQQADIERALLMMKSIKEDLQ